MIGAGVVGLSAAANLRARGAEVTCYERSTAAMNERSSGSSRIFRLPHPTHELVRLAQSARVGFRRWEEEAGTPLITNSGCVVSGVDVANWVSAMRAAGVPFELANATSERLRLPALVPPAEAIIDPSGGVVNVDSVRTHLVALARHTIVHEPVYALENDPAGATVWSPTGTARFDAVVIAAGAGTSALAAQVGIYTPSSLAHHFRFTFPIDRSAEWQSWIDKPEAGLSTYQHPSSPGMWSIGGQVDSTLTAWEVGRDAAAAASREAVLRYVREQLTVEPLIVDSLYCTTTPNLGDGFEIRRNGSIVAVYGENLFKLAPVLGEVLAGACIDGSTPSIEELASR